MSSPVGNPRSFEIASIRRSFVHPLEDKSTLDGIVFERLPFGRTMKRSDEIVLAVFLTVAVAACVWIVHVALSAVSQDSVCIRDAVEYLQWCM
jgi:hypothetical protein